MFGLGHYDKLIIKPTEENILPKKVRQNVFLIFLF